METPPGLPAWKAFLVQFSRDTKRGSGIFSGRVEHLNSGRRAHFSSTRELVVALARLLALVDEPEERRR